MNKIQVVGLGDCTLDYLAVVAQYPPLDAKIETLDLVESGGGPAATAMVTLERLGIHTLFAGKVGGDERGRLVAESLAKEGVDIRNLVFQMGQASSFSFIVIDRQTGQRTVFHNAGGVAKLTQSEITPDTVCAGKLLHLDGHQMEVSLLAVEWARRAGVAVVLDAGSLRPGMEALARAATYVVASRKFGRQFALTDEIQVAARRLLALGPRAVVVTDGENGGYCVSREREFHYPAYKIEALDTTGAGDVFHGAFDFGLLQGWELEKTVRFASIAAALKCRQIGGRAGIPALREVLDIM